MDEFLLFGLSVALGFCAWGYVCFHYVWPTINQRSPLWAFNLWGAADLLFAFYGGLFGPDFHPSALGASFYIPTIYVSLLLCTHAMLFVLLMRPRTAAEAPFVTAQA